MAKEARELGITADPEAVQRERDKDRLRVAQEASDIIALMSTEAGRRFAATLVKKCGVGSIAFRSTDRETAFALGAQNLGHWFVANCKSYCPELFSLMEAEDRANVSNN